MSRLAGSEIRGRARARATCTSTYTISVATLAALAIAGPAFAAPRGGVVKVEHRAPSAPPTFGPKDAPVTIEVFFMPSASALRNRYVVAAQHVAATT